MSTTWKRKSWWIIALAIIAGVLLFALRPPVVTVDLAEVEHGRFQQSVVEEGKTRVRERYIVSAPLEGMLERIHLKVGDPVEEGMPLATIYPKAPVLLDVRTEQELQERLRVAEATKQRTQAARARAQATLDQANLDYERTRALAEEGLVTRAQREHDELTVRLAAKDVLAAKFEDQAASHHVDLARAALARVQSRGKESAPAPQRWDILSPVLGRVLHVFQESEDVVTLGAPLLEVANPADLEVVADVLTTDAVQIEAGAQVWLERWGGDESIEGRVRLVEPSAFTKVSALGVEEQRVNVVIDVVTTDAQWKAMGDGYRVDARIVVFTQEQAVKAPTGALFREGDGWAVFVVEQGRAHKRSIHVSRRNGLEALTDSGLVPGEQVIIYPSDAVRDGVRVKPRQSTAW